MTPTRDQRTFNRNGYRERRSQRGDLLTHEQGGRLRSRSCRTDAGSLFRLRDRYCGACRPSAFSTSTSGVVRPLVLVTTPKLV
jgi:hypothetical protein